MTITITQPGAAPAQLETEVARKVGKHRATLTGIKNIYTTVIDGTSSTVVEFELEKNITDAVDRDARCGVADPFRPAG